MGLNDPQWGNKNSGGPPDLEEVMRKLNRKIESLFGKFANLHPRILWIKLDGATKEEFVWGFRTGFITFADGNSFENSKVMAVL